ncbi:glutamate racemase [Caldibacillus lycopersici]|uniref:Glutamate racemase n=1 Tax=Perspicuibacillus lycopersici TaxID=1325689 RepID=A0AAE3IWA6_9BACI|nr:glutamate racemase [Perspicuibacillus lycopersici]MCU9614054.1 glutamate racemase [Perspicuibacillus lycopersici]
MSSKPIGIIDSGVGGLTVVKEMMRQLPNEPIVYIGDTARCPYGPRPCEEIKKFTWEMVHYLEKFEIKMLIIACNTATAVALKEIRSELPIPVLGVINPGARAAIKVSKRNQIGVIGTAMTINSKAYELALKSIRKHISVHGLACPKFVPLVESGEWSGPIAKEIIEDTLAPLKTTPIDTLILGCTHYPLLEPLINSYFASKVKIISSGEETAREASVILEHTHSLNDEADHLFHQFFTTGSKTIFKAIAKQWLELEDITVQSIKLI